MYQCLFTKPGRTAFSSLLCLVLASQDTIGDKEKFTAADAWPKVFFLDPQYDMSLLSADGAVARIAQQGLLLCAVGSIESLMTAEVVSSFTKSTHHSGMVVAAMAVGNVVSGFLGGMGGNAMIGLSTIACLNGGRRRIAPVVTALAIFVCVPAAYPVLNYIPIAALVGIMMIVVRCVPAITAPKYALLRTAVSAATRH